MAKRTAKKPATKKVRKESSKKTAKKSTPKKKPVKKPAKRRTKKIRTKHETHKKKKTAVRCAPEQSFWVHFGPILYDIHDLLQSMKLMSDDQFAHHRNQEKNDFARWVEDVLNEKPLARKLQKCTNKNDAYKAVAEYVRLHY